MPVSVKNGEELHDFVVEIIPTVKTRSAELEIREDIRDTVEYGCAGKTPSMSRLQAEDALG